jgi:predicted RNA binding protein YcfA (HicA-like mRNA interferase family)
MPRRITPTRWRTQEKIFLADGFTLAREESSHRSYVKPGILRPVVIPKYREVPVSIIRNNMTTANMSRERYFELLDRVK